MFTQSLEKTLKQDLIIQTIVKQTIIGLKKDDLVKKNNGKVCCVEIKNIQVLNRCQ